MTMKKINIFDQIICGDIELVLSAIARKYQTVRQEDIQKLKIDIMTTAKLTDPIYITADYQIVDGWKRLGILKELYKEEFRLEVEPVFITIDSPEQQDEIYISKNVMVNRYKKSWLAIIAAENILPDNRRIAQARRGIKQEEKFDACVATGLAFGISGKLVQQADDVLKSQHGLFLREKIRLEELTVTQAYEIVSRQLDGRLNGMTNGKTYKEVTNDSQRDGQAKREHRKYQERQRYAEKNQLEFQQHISGVVQTTETTETPKSDETKAVSNVVNMPTQSENQSENTKIHFIGALSADCSTEFKTELEQLMKKYTPNSEIVFVQKRLKLQQLVYENNLDYSDVIRAA